MDDKEIKPLKRQIAKLEAENDKLKGKELEKAASASDSFDGYEGAYKQLSTGQVFKLKVVDDALVRSHKTHLAKSATHFGDYTAAEFRALFDKL
jgi:hypothetical protein